MRTHKHPLFLTALAGLLVGSVGIGGIQMSGAAPPEKPPAPPTEVKVVNDATSPVPVSDGTGSLTVDGTVGVSGSVTVQDGTGPLTVDGTVTAQDGGGSLTVDGTVKAQQDGTWTFSGPATQAVTGTVNVGNTTPIPVAEAVKTVVLALDSDAVAAGESYAKQLDVSRARAVRVAVKCFGPGAACGSVQVNVLNGAYELWSGETAFPLGSVTLGTFLEGGWVGDALFEYVGPSVVIRITNNGSSEIFFMYGVLGRSN